MWVEFVVGSRPCSEGFFSLYSNFQFDLDVKCLQMSSWLGRLGDYFLHYDFKILFADFYIYRFTLFTLATLSLAPSFDDNVIREVRLSRDP